MQLEPGADSEPDPRRRGRPPLSEGPDARDRLLHAARELFSEVGYEKTSFKEIAQRAGVTRPTVNRYFRNKELLYAALFASMSETVVAAGVKNASNAETAVAQLAAFIEGAVQVDSEDRSHGKFVAASLVDAFRHPNLRDQASHQIDDVRSFVEQALRTGLERGELTADLDVAAVTEMVIAVLWGMGLYAGFVGTHDQLESVVTQFNRLLAGRLW